MSKSLETTAHSAGQGNEGCGCGAYGQHRQSEKPRTAASNEPGRSSGSENDHGKHSRDQSGCCGGGSIRG